ncbi:MULTISPECIES: hypothetical protein [Archaeoglobus]|jgi:hypothetical protein|uniref:Uncharacterized protein n=2 Tax=Archaeoglobus fulgidus TaxID=2234 RepID=A0A075WEZ2_ARCFL|nr:MULTISPECIES: hypothetical protein [Archaeoglobus]AIG98531.1 hypothetical protein AFULGI_00017740 [Archaeoglobus fulgidus DSM 8774]KUJ94212.1 MAG: hypothetical protein XD40_0584 [Archaeoglobus fulgidus]KUK06723.1 MAG: Uncharacterized protein XD48_1053 [Archaeoglobus fulgidus]MDI3496781.1 hypothetical protein [Archaeoglobus sp.]
MYLEVWVNHLEREKALEKLKEICEEVHEVFYDYDYIVRYSGSEEDLLKVEGVKRVRRHYNC